MGADCCSLLVPNPVFLTIFNQKDFEMQKEKQKSNIRNSLIFQMVFQWFKINFYFIKKGRTALKTNDLFSVLIDTTILQHTPTVHTPL